MKSTSIREKFNVKPHENGLPHACVIVFSTNAKHAFSLKYVQLQVQLSLSESACELKS